MYRTLFLQTYVKNTVIDATVASNRPLNTTTRPYAVCVTNCGKSNDGEPNTARNGLCTTKKKLRALENDTYLGNSTTYVPRSTAIAQTSYSTVFRAKKDLL